MMPRALVCPVVFRAWIDRADEAVECATFGSRADAYHNGQWHDAAGSVERRLGQRCHARGRPLAEESVQMLLWLRQLARNVGVDLRRIPCRTFEAPRRRSADA